MCSTNFFKLLDGTLCVCLYKGHSINIVNVFEKSKNIFPEFLSINIYSTLEILVYNKIYFNLAKIFVLRLLNNSKSNSARGLSSNFW